jgi:Mrp family chromosome partitioning ATPase/capsular polysaccharide biosynthesis protein
MEVVAMDQTKFLNIVRRYAWVLVLAALVASLTTFFVLNGEPTMYEAKTRLLVGPTLDSPSPDINSLRIGGQLMTTYADLATTRPFLESINNKLDQKINLEVLGGMMEIRQNADARILTIFVRHTDPKQAVAIANAAAQSLIERSPSHDQTTAELRSKLTEQSRQLEQVVSNANAAIPKLEAEYASWAKQAEDLEALGQTPETSKDLAHAWGHMSFLMTQITEQRSRASDALRMLTTMYGLLSGADTNQIEIIEPAGAVFPVNQNLPLRAAASALAGMLLVMSLIFAYEYFDDTIRVPGDFTRTIKVPLLSSIEKHNHRAAPGLQRVVTFAEPNSQAANDYRTAVAKLLFTIGNSMPYTLMLSSVASQAGDDTAMTAANLAAAFSQAGNRVALVDAQLNNPVLTKLFDANGKAGLSDLLATKSAELKLLSVKDLPNVQLLPVGLSTEKWPGAMLNPVNVDRLVKELEKQADIVIVASPPIADFAESLALASQVNGVVLVARYGSVHSKMINEVAETLKTMNVDLVGVIFEQSSSPFAAKRNGKRTSTVASVTPRVNNPQIEPTGEKSNTS